MYPDTGRGLNNCPGKAKYHYREMARLPFQKLILRFGYFFTEGTQEGGKDLMPNLIKNLWTKRPKQKSPKPIQG